MIELNHSPLGLFIDWIELDSRVNGDRELIHELFELLQDAFPKELSEMKSATERGELERVLLAAHTLKGMLSNLSFKRCVLLAANIEDAARLGDSVEIDKAVKAFERETEPLLPALRSFMKGLSQ